MTAEVLAVTVLGDGKHELTCRSCNGSVFTMVYENMHPDMRPDSPSIGEVFII